MTAFNLYIWRDDLLATDLPTHSKIIGLILLTFMNEHKHTAYPSIKRLAKLASMTPRSCIKHVKNLVDARFLKKLGRYDQSKNYTNVYRLDTEYHKQCDKSKSEQVNEIHLDEKQNDSIGELDSPDRCISFTNLVNEVHPNKQENKQENKQIYNICSSSENSEFRLQASDSETSITLAPDNQRLQDTQNASTLVNDRFAEFWHLYPRKVAKQKAFEAFNKLKPDDDLFDQIISGLRRLIDLEWDQNEMQYIPYPATFINGKRWNDEPTPRAIPDQKLSAVDRAALKLKEIQEQERLERLNIDSTHGMTLDATESRNNAKSMAEDDTNLWSWMDSGARFIGY